MQIALYDVDSTIPNLALMRLARFHLEKGDTVVRFDPKFPLEWSSYDKVYASKVFGFTPGPGLDPDRMIIGGTGWSTASALPPEVDSLPPHYGLYAGFEGNIGYTMRGCRMSCGFCVVPEKEGRARSVSRISELLVQDSEFLMLLDNDFFGNPEWRDRIEEIRSRDLQVNFSQGLNIRLITDEQAEALASVRFTNSKRSRDQVHFAWDRPKDESRVLAGIERCRAAGIKPWRMAFYVLVGYGTTEEEDIRRVMILRDLGCDIYAMAYDLSDPYQVAFRRWVNGHIYKTTQFSDYQPNLRKAPNPRGSTVGPRRQGQFRDPQALGV